MWLDIRRVNGDIPRAFWMIGMSFCTIFQTSNNILFLSKSIDILYSTPRYLVGYQLFIYIPVSYSNLTYDMGLNPIRLYVPLASL